MNPRTALLVIPPCFVSRELDFEIGFPAHLLVLQRVVQESGWLCTVLDMTLEEKDGVDSYSVLDRYLEDGQLRWIGISNHTVRTSVTTRAVAEHVKQRRPDVLVLVGGVNATFMWRELLTGCHAIDLILRGYSQPSLRWLLQAMERGSCLRVPGVVARAGDGPVCEPMPPVSADDFAAPDLQGINARRYLSWTRTYPLLTHTGCQFSCNFCTSVMPGPYQNREVHRPAWDVIAEMQAALDTGFTSFSMTANVFTTHRERCLDLLRALCAAGIQEQATWSCMSRVEFVDAELLSTMRAAGCVNIAFGVEAVGKAQWRSLRKGRFSEDVIVRAFDSARAAGLTTSSFLILGAPTQTQEDIEATVAFIREVDPEYRVVNFFQPFPGTPYWSDPESHGLSEIAPLEEWNFHEAPICRTRHLDKDALLRAAVRLYLDRDPDLPLNPESDSLHLPVIEAAILDDAPDFVRETVAACASGTIAGALRVLRERHGNREHLIALYWLSALLRRGVLQRRPGASARPCGAPPFSRHFRPEEENLVTH